MTEKEIVTLNKKQLDFLIHCIAMSMAATCRNPSDKRIEIENYINKTFDELGDKMTECMWFIAVKSNREDGKFVYTETSEVLSEEEVIDDIIEYWEDMQNASWNLEKVCFKHSHAL